MIYDFVFSVWNYLRALSSLEIDFVTCEQHSTTCLPFFSFVSSENGNNDKNATKALNKS